MADMYHILFYEGGRLLTEVGGPIQTLPEALGQIKRMTCGTNCVELEDVVGCKWERAGMTPCALIIVDEWGKPIRNGKES